MKVLALDVSASTGWARWRPGLNRPDYGTKKFIGPLAKRALGFEEWVVERIVADEITDVVAEALILPRDHLDINSIRWLCGANLILHKVCLQHGVPLEEIALATWRVHFIGVHVGPKEMSKYERRKFLKNLARDRCAALGWPVENDNEADALGVLDCYRSRLPLGKRT